MVLYEKKIKRPRTELLEKAKSYFGPDGLGLDMTDEQECCLSFEGGGGYVNVMITDEKPQQTTFEVESKEWDYHARQFIGTV